MQQHRHPKPFSLLPIALLFLWVSGCTLYLRAEHLQTASVASGTKGDERWAVVRMDLDIELCPCHSKLFGKGAARLRLVSGSSFGPTLKLNNVSRFTKCAAEVGKPVRVEMTPHQAKVRFPQPLHAGEEVDVTYEFSSGGASSPIVLTPACAYTGCHGNWYPEPLVGSAVAPGTTRLDVPEDWRTVANGQLTESRTEDGRRIDTWKTEVPTARSFAAGPYSV